MNKDALQNAIAAVLIALNLMLRPVTPAEAAWAALFALICCLPGLILGRKNAMHANVLGFGDMLHIGLPAALLIAPHTPAVGIFAAVHMLLYRFLGGWLLKQQGLSAEKNFTLILAYRQTLKHRAHFPDEIHPGENPLFDAARRAQTALLQLAPLLGLPVGLMLRCPDAIAAPAIRALCIAALALSLLRRPFLPKGAPSRLAVVTIFCHLPMACIPPYTDIPSDSGLFKDAKEAFCWCRLAFLLMLPLAFLMK